MTTFVEPPFWALSPYRARQHVGLSLVTGPTVEPVSVAEVKTQLRLDDTNGEPAPTAPTVALVSVAGLVTAGVHRWLWVARTVGGHTEAGAVSSALTTILATHGQATVTKPTGGSAVTYMDLYRTAAGGSTYLLVAATANDGATYTDNVADGSLGAQAPVTNTTDDPQLLALITGARMHCEAVTDRALCTQTWRQTFSRWPGLPLTLVKAPLQATPTAPIVTYIDTAGVTQTLATTQYSVEAPAGPYASPGRLLPVYAPTVYPVTAYGMLSTATVQYVAGYGAAVDVPWPIKQAMLLLIAHWWSNREAVSVGPSASELPLAVASLLAPFCPEDVA
jgi:uncharacterized phiE125 gp8 family phage protein